MEQIELHGADLNKIFEKVSETQARIKITDGEKATVLIPIEDLGDLETAEHYFNMRALQGALRNRKTGELVPFEDIDWSQDA